MPYTFGLLFRHEATVLAVRRVATADMSCAAEQRAGYVANIIKVMGLDAHSAQASMQFYISLMKSENALSKTQKEMLATIVSNINDCYY